MVRIWLDSSKVDFCCKMPHRVCCSVVSFKGDIYVIGGYSGLEGSTREVDRINPKEGRVFKTGSMVFSREDFATAVTPSNLYVFGGYDSSSKSYQTCWEYYNPTTGKQVVYISSYVY